MAAALITHSFLFVFRNHVYLLYKIIDAQAGQLVVLQRCVQIVHICLMVSRMMNLHGYGIEVRFECIVAVAERRLRGDQHGLCTLDMLIMLTQTLTSLYVIVSLLLTIGTRLRELSTRDYSTMTKQAPLRDQSEPLHLQRRSPALSRRYQYQHLVPRIDRLTKLFPVSHKESAKVKFLIWTMTGKDLFCNGDEGASDHQGLNVLAMRRNEAVFGLSTSLDKPPL